MSTRCHIGVENADDTVTFVYCHHDGYPEVPGAGKKLLDHYATDARVRELLLGGDLSALYERCDKPEGHTFENHRDGYCIYYGRDRGEPAKDVAPRTLPREEALKHMDEEYTYVFTREGRWFYRDHGGPWMRLTPEVCK